MSRDDEFSLSDDVPAQEAEASQDSQSIDTAAIQVMLEQHKQDLKKRRRQRQEAIKAAHKARIEKLAKAKERAEARYEESLRAIRRPKIEQMLQLIQMKREISDKIDNCIQQKEDAFMGVASKFRLAIDARSAISQSGD